jgi:hypothetical protein
MKRIFLGGLALLWAGCLVPSMNAATFFYFTSAPSSWIGQGQTLTLTNGFFVSRNGNALEFGASGYYLDIGGPNFELARVGFYSNATRYPFNSVGPGLSFTGPGRGDNMLTGCFNVMQADFDAAGQVTAFAVDFVQYDETFLAKWNRGSVRFNSNIPAPGPPPPMFMGKLVRTNGLVTISMSGPPDTICLVQTSSNLATWLPFVTNTISPVGLLSIFDTNAAVGAGRFYRVVTTNGGGGGSSGNDLFANRIQIPSAGGTVTGSNTNATKETGEPNHANAPGGKSVWWTWTAPSTGLVTVSLDGSSFDTTLGVYQGTNVASLVSIAQDDEGGAGSCSRVLFNAVAGATYQIAVDGYFGSSGNINLTVKPGLLNDNFADRLEMKGTYDFVIGSTVGATYEIDEPYHWAMTGVQSVWWKWQAPNSGPVTISTAGSNFDTILAAYTGTTMATLALVANNDDFGGSITSQINFIATAGTVYQIAVDGYEFAAGSVNLQVSQ